MGLPKAVLAQQAEAERLFKAQGVEEVKDVELEIDPNLLKKDEEDEVLNIDPDNLNNIQTLNNQEKNEPAKIIKEAPKKDESNEEVETLKRLNRSLDNENRTLKIKRGDHEREISSLKAELVNLKEELTKKQTPAAEPVSQKFSEDERNIFLSEGFSDELIDVFEKRGVQPQAAQKVDDSRIQTLEQEILSVRNETAQTKEESFWSKLDSTIPNWEKINVEQGFLDFLQTVPPYSDKTLYDMLTEARQNLDAPKIVKIFTDYQTNNGAVSQQATEPEPKEVKKSGPSLTDLAAPKSSNPTLPSAKLGKWTTEQITKFYQDDARNPGKYTDKQRLAIEKTYIYPN